MVRIALKVDVDTYRGIEEGASHLASFLHPRRFPPVFL